jgi:hypothetical protein
MDDRAGAGVNFQGKYLRSEFNTRIKHLMPL